jgi:hypothetical protein
MLTSEKSQIQGHQSIEVTVGNKIVKNQNNV